MTPLVPLKQTLFGLVYLNSQLNSGADQTSGQRPPKGGGVCEAQPLFMGDYLSTMETHRGITKLVWEFPDT